KYCLPIRKLERIVMHPRLVLVDLTKDRRLVGHPARTQAEESGCGACNIPGKRKFRSRKNAHCHGGIFLGGNSTCAGTKIARGELGAASCSTRLHIVQAVVAHGEDSSCQAPRTSTAILKAIKVPILWRDEKSPPMPPARSRPLR